MIVLYPLVWLALIFAVSLAYRFVRRRSAITARWLAVGILLRAAIGVPLFLVSLYELPIFTGLYRGGGFWIAALDAESYFRIAADAAQRGLSVITDSSPSPTFLRALAVWMRLVGISPASAILFNVFCYAAAVLLLVAVASRRPKTPAQAQRTAIAVAALSCSPALLVFGTQPLKDEFFVLLISMALVGIRLVADFVADQHDRPWTTGVLGVGLLTLSVHAVTGVRAYYGFLILVSVFVAGLVTLIVCVPTLSRLRLLTGYCGLMLLLWNAYTTAAGPNFQRGVYFAAMFAHPLKSMVKIRTVFTETGGGTQIDRTRQPAVATDAADLDLDVHIRRFLVGIGLIFVPVSLLKAMSIVQMTRGHALLYVADVDTIVIDLFVIAAIVVLWKTRSRSAPEIGVALFSTVLALLTLAVLAYVVTNYGTLFRLRLIAVAPVWLLPPLLRIRSDAVTPSPVTKPSFVV